MTTKRIPLTAVNVQLAKPTTRFGTPARVSFTANSWLMVRASLAGIPANAVVSSAYVELAQEAAWAGGPFQVLAKIASAAWNTSTTWATRPGFAGDAGNQTRSGITALSLWQIPVTATVQAWIAGSLANNGLVLYPPTGGTTVRGQSAASLTPVLVVNYDVPAPMPTALHPSGGGVVSVTKPTLTFQAPAATIAIQVQVDPAANGSSPAFDSGEVASTAGLLDLSTTSFAALANNATTQWRARVKGPLGWSDWSGWVSFKRTAWGTLTVTSPGSTSEDPSPVIQATYSGTVTSWHAVLRDSAGNLMEQSLWTPGSAMSYGTTRAVDGSGTAYMQIRDNVVGRVTTPGDPEHLTASVAFTVTPSGTPTALASLAAAPDGVKPTVRLTATRSAIPDEVAIYRNNVLVARVPGADVFSGTNFTYDDTSAPMNTSLTYSVRAVVNGNWSNAATAAAVTARCKGIWIRDTLSTQAVAIWTGEDQDQSQPETAIVHTPLSGFDGPVQVVRRRLARYPRQGAITGQLNDAMGIDVATCEANLRAWAANDAGHLYRLTLGHQNDQVILGDITFSEVPEDGAERIVDVSLNWWVQSA